MDGYRRGYGEWVGAKARARTHTQAATLCLTRSTHDESAAEIRWIHNIHEEAEESCVMHNEITTI